MGVGIGITRLKLIVFFIVEQRILNHLLIRNTNSNKALMTTLISTFF